MADLKFGDRTYRKMGDTWMMQPTTLMRGFIAVSEESTIAMLDEIVRLRAAGDALAVFVRRFGDVDNWTQQGSFIFDDRLLSAVVEWQEARGER